MMQKLPIGIQDFRTIREEGYLYLDKTEDIFNLIRLGKIYFLSRPRRFGKTLLVSTMECLFKGERELFKGLWIEDKWDWDDVYPVVRLDMSSILIEKAEDVDTAICAELRNKAEEEKIEITGNDRVEIFKSLIRRLRNKYQKKIVVLIDEYDAPIISNLDDIDKAKTIRDKIRNFYRVLKSEEAGLRFIFLTGVSKFSKAGVFSALNNLQDITIDSRFATMLGITQEEIEKYFEKHISALAQKQGISKEDTLERIRNWYNGFCFDGEAKEASRVYNPFSTLLLFVQQAFRNYWFDSGSPKFLIDLLKQNEYDISRLDKLEAGAISFNAYEPEDLKIEALLLQTGYLTIKRHIEGEIYELGFPNKEIKECFSAYIIDAYGSLDRGESQVYVYKMRKALEQDPPDFERFMDKIKAFFAGIPYDIHDKIKAKEQYYQTIIYAVLAMLGLEVRGEIRVSRGRIDLMFKLGRAAFIIECKLNAPAEDALKQIKEKGYMDAYSAENKLYLIGISLDTFEKNIKEYLVETVGN